MAWLNATPKPDERSRRAKSQGDAARLSRADRMRKRGIKPQMPPNSLPSIIAQLVEIGMTEAAGMGVVPVSWATISAWQSITGVDLAPWEARLIRHLSCEYIAEGRRAEAETCPPPWKPPVTAREIETEDDVLTMVLG